ncbi:DUF4148 domain-containing protein [Ramlibacter algicola]|jgi:hypothetical protein|uniref:DUF4148 domain-containing protein n=1 Tax=Ramlibacter algicola TaxID=2795217 RepID=A0A934URC7_9BURK|nr:DUF4148 domain-containing protein [Ramlibacter algicola]MBK0392726.1 DUF4148 domain-containing protein [Ramlibacter algicola]
MNVRTVIALAAFAVAGTAFAQSSQEIGQPDAFTPTKTRAQVQAELAQFKKDYPVSPWSFRYDQLAGFQSTVSRDEVRADYIANREEVAARNSEDSGASYLAAHARQARVNPTASAE